MHAIKLKVHIGPDKRLIIDLPDDVQEGIAEVILLTDDAISEPRRHANFNEWLDSFLKNRPSGVSREEIDKRIEEERNSWD